MWDPSLTQSQSRVLDLVLVLIRIRDHVHAHVLDGHDDLTLDFLRIHDPDEVSIPDSCHLPLGLGPAKSMLTRPEVDEAVGEE